MFVPSSELGRVAELYNRGLYLQAYRVAQSTGPLSKWGGTEARLLAGRLASNLGAPRLGRTHHIRAWRYDRSHAGACYFYARVINESRGPLAALKFMRQCGEPADAPPQSRAEWLSLEAYLLGLLRDFDAAEDRLRLAEKLDPNNAWVSVEHAALLWQLVDMQQLDEALQLAEQSTERFPLIPRLWYDLSLVHQAQLDHRGEIAALQEALKINLGWGVAARQLAEAHQKEGELDKARTILEQATACTPLDPCNHGCLADVLWKLGEKEQALAQLQRALALEPDYGWGWNVLREWSKQLNCPEAAANFARDLTTQRAGEARSWLILVRMLTDPQDLPERLAAIDHALELSLRSVEAHTLRVQLLAEAKRFDEAQTACHPPVFGDDLPLDLRSSEVRVIAERGNLQEAVRKMRALLDDEPNYYAGWSQLADWCRALEWTRAYLEAARAMARLAPNYHLALGYLGDALMINGYRQEAKEALRRAVILEPGYEYAGVTLLNLQVEDGELEQAREMLELLRRHVGGEVTFSCEVKLAARMRNREAAEESFRQLCLPSTQDCSLFDEAVLAMAEANWDELVDRILDESLTLAAANPLVRSLWVERLRGRRGFRKYRKRLETLSEKGELWHEASIAYLDAPAKAKKRKLARRFIWQHQYQLRSKTFTWGRSGMRSFSWKRLKRPSNGCQIGQTAAMLRPGCYGIWRSHCV